MEEEFDGRKVCASVYSACLVAEMPKKGAESLADKAAQATKKWVDGTTHTDSGKIFQFVVSFLKKENKEAAFLYETYRDIS